MNQTVLVQLIVSAATILGGMFALIKYSINQNSKREKIVLDFLQKMQTENLEYNTTKNGHMERMAKTFTLASNKMSKAVNNLATQVAVLKERKKK